MKNPYEVLGISPDATDDEVKTAYRNLAKKYHPDNYSQNPLSDLAEEKMQEINEAYDAIMNSRRTNAGSDTSGSYSSDAGTSSFPEIRSLISQGRLEQAQELLDGVMPSERNAEWYFLNGTVLYRRGWFDQAYTSFVTASRMDPANSEYKSAVNNAQRQMGKQYNNPYAQRAYGGGCDACDVCSSLVCADCCCECMGGDLIPCC